MDQVELHEHFDSFSPIFLLEQQAYNNTAEYDNGDLVLFDRQAALAAYEEATQLAPHEAILYFHKGLVLEQLGREEEARRAFNEARGLGYPGTNAH